MAAPYGNEFWKNRTRHGVKPLFEDPELLRKECMAYFEWSTNNPLMEAKASVQGGEVIHYYVPKMRPFTQGGLCIYLNITQDTWIRWRNSTGENNDLSEVVKDIDEIIRTQKFEGAAADMLNSNIIARDLGLADKRENEHAGPDGGPIETRSSFIFTPVGNDDNRD